MDRTKSPAYRALPSRSARRMLATIATLAADNDGVATCSYTDLRLPPHGYGRPSISTSLKLLIAVGLIDAIAPGPRMVGRYVLSDRWRGMDADEAKRMAREARAPLSMRRHEKRRAVDPPRPVRVIEPPPMQVEADETSEPPPEVRTPSMPVLHWLGR